MSDLNTEQQFEAGRQAAWDAMREQGGEQQFGAQEREASQGYREMDSAFPVPKEPAGLDIEENREQVLRDAADELTKQRGEDRPGEKPVMVREYTELATGKPKDERETLSVEQASSDLSGAREREKATAEQSEEAELARLIDEMRSGVSTEPQAQPQPVEQQPQPQPQYQQQPELTEQQRMAEVLRQNPALLSGMSAAIEQEQARYAAAVHNNSQAAMAHMLASFPELQGITDPNHLAGALHAVRSRDPARAAAITEGIARTRQLFEESQHVAQWQQQQQQARVQQWVNQYDANMRQQFAQHDQAYSQWANNQGVSRDAQEQIKQEVLDEFARQGLSKEDIAREYNSNMAMRSFAGQVQLHQAAAYRLQQRTMTNVRRNKLDRSAPHVQRPGSPLLIAQEEDVQMRHLNKGGGPLTPREAADLVNAQRARRARGR